MKTRKDALSDLLFYHAPIELLQRQLKAFPWDSEEVLAVVTTAHVTHILQRYLAGELLASQVEDWANAIEGREDLAYFPTQQALIEEVIHQLANPLLTIPLSEANAEALIAKLDV